VASTITQPEVDRGRDAGIDGWADLYRISGWAALLGAAIIPLSIIAYFIWPPFPDDILTIIQGNRLAGLMSLDFMYLAANVVGLPVFLALYVTLRRANPSLALLALALGPIGLVALIPARPIVEMVALSDRYAVAASEAERVALRAVGDALLAQFRGTAYNAHYVLGSLSLLISAALMFRGEVYSRATAWVGLVTNVVVFGLYVPVVGAYISLLSVVGYLIWWIQIGTRLLRLAREA
jgi:hypothetical protein